MNEQQHDAKVLLGVRLTQVRLCRAAYVEADHAWFDAAVALRQAIEADEESWYGTPGIDPPGIDP